MEQRSIALDGPGGAGKSTLARMAAMRFKLIYVDTGALYRCVALHVLRNGVDTKDEPSVAELLPKIKIEMMYDDEGVQRMLLDGNDVTDEIRSPDVSMGASNVSALPTVREHLLSMQREMAVKYDVIMDGRDIGTVILPNAGLKVFLTAASETRAMRRYLELVEKNVATTLEEVQSDMVLRDKNDSERAAAPLKAAEDAIMLDTTALNLEESFNALCDMISERLCI